MLWGYEAIRDFAQILLPSVMQPHNLPAVAAIGLDLRWDMYTTPEDAPQVEGLFKAYPAALRPTFVIRSLADNSMATKFAFFSEFFEEAGDAAGIVLHADHFLADGTLAHVVHYAAPLGVSVGVPYVRCQRDPFLSYSTSAIAPEHGGYLTPPEVVTIALRTMIPAMAESYGDLDTSPTWDTGVIFRRITPTLTIQIQHTQAPFLYHMNDRDRAWFRSHRDFSRVDHGWTARLIREGRWRMIGSSDLGFIAELDDEATVARAHTYASREGRVFAEDFCWQDADTLTHEAFLVLLRSSEPVTP